VAGKTTDGQRELARRASTGIEVVLFWRQDTNDLSVAIWDGHSATYFELAVAADQALDVFNHPYAHAASRGLPFVNEACRTTGYADPTG
jgi:hypothetical protein